jgi:hypothetical protein
MTPNDDKGGGMPRQDMHIGEIRELAKRFTPQQLEDCIGRQLSEGSNPCDTEASVEETINVLAKAEYVKHLVEQGMSVNEAIRELGRRVRAAQQASSE